MKDLFTPAADPARNLLPADGEVFYHGPVLAPAEADRCFGVLHDEIQWRQDEVILFGKRIVTRRMVAWYGDAGMHYTYSGMKRAPLPWTEPLLMLRQIAEQHSGATYNSCLLNRYHDGTEGMGWHSDDEADLLPGGAIASLSLGAERRFQFRHKATGTTVEVLLEHGSLLVMQGATQTHWKHRLPPARRIKAPRINLTFRTIAR